MKLWDLFEAIPVGKHPEFTQEQIRSAEAWLRDDSSSLPIEGGRYNILHKEGTYALERVSSGEILGWVMFDQKIQRFGREVNPLTNIQILPRYRNTTALLILINSVRELIDGPVYIDDPIFKDGQQLLSALSKRPNMPKVFTVDKNTGDVKPYSSGDLSLDDSTAVMLEKTYHGLSGSVHLPGQQINTTYILFEGMYEGIE